MSFSPRLTNRAIFDIAYEQELNRLDNIFRFSGNPTIVRESVSQHSYWVCYMCVILYDRYVSDKMKHHLPISYLLLRAIYHDFDEVVTGDLIHHLKHGHDHSSKLSELLKKIIEEKIGQNIFLLENNLLFEGMIGSTIAHFDDDRKTRCKTILDKMLKAADWMSCCKYVNSEALLGNSQLKLLLDYCEQKTNQIISELEFLININYKSDATE